MKVLKRILLGLIVILIIIQFIRPTRNISEAYPAHEITAAVSVPVNIQAILKTSCYDCHSNNTRYPWYVNIQPAAWFMSNHIEEGKRRLNFSEFAGYSPKRQLRKFNDIIENVNDGEMPLSSYLLIHTESKLSTEQKETLVAWANAAIDSMKIKYPADSLSSKR